MSFGSLLCVNLTWLEASLFQVRRITTKRGFVGRMGSEWTRKETNFESTTFVTTAGQILAPSEGQSFQRLSMAQSHADTVFKGVCALPRVRSLGP